MEEVVHQRAASEHQGTGARGGGNEVAPVAARGGQPQDVAVAADVHTGEHLDGCGVHIVGIWVVLAVRAHCEVVLQYGEGVWRG